MAENNDASRTEQPTPRRREEARQRGNIARSHDLTASVALLAAVVSFHYLGMGLFESLRNATASMLAGDGAYNPARPLGIASELQIAGKAAMVAAGPFVLAIAAVVLLVSLGQVGFNFTTVPLEWNFSKLNPIRGLGHLFELRAGMRFVMSLAKVGLLAGVGTWIVMGDIPNMLGLSALEPWPLLGTTCSIVYSLALKLALLLVLLAVIDYLYQYWQRERDLLMTKDEVREEMKRMDGDPLIRQRRSRVARQLALQRIGQAVPKADVVVTNPTHYAVALQYDAESMRAPKVVAKGADFLALRIRQLAMMHGVPIVERRELAQALYKTVEPGQEIPPTLYAAVAEILAYVYRIGGKVVA